MLTKKIKQINALNVNKNKKIQTNKCTNINQIVCETGPEYCLVIRFTSNYQNFILENV